MIPRIDIAPLFGSDGPERRSVDAAILDAASVHGFMTVTGLPEAARLDPARRRDLLRLFDLSEAQQRLLWRQKFDPARPNVYRGWFPAQEGAVTHKEGVDMGPDCAYGAAVVDPTDPLLEATPMPAEEVLPGWRAAVAAYYRAMEQVARALMRAIARGLALPETTFDHGFEGGISTLRLLRYPVRSIEALEALGNPELWVTHKGRRYVAAGHAHVDSGFMTLLAQDGVSGLQAQARNGDWIDVPPEEGTLAVNFGQVLQRWTGGRLRATRHRVLGFGQERFSIPFFYEPRVDLEISPLPIPGVESFEPFVFGDYLWETVTKFVEFHGMEGLRAPRRARVTATGAFGTGG